MLYRIFHIYFFVYVWISHVCSLQNTPLCERMPFSLKGLWSGKVFRLRLPLTASTAGSVSPLPAAHLSRHSSEGGVEVQWNKQGLGVTMHYSPRASTSPQVPPSAPYSVSTSHVMQTPPNSASKKLPTTQELSPINKREIESSVQQFSFPPSSISMGAWYNPNSKDNFSLPTLRVSPAFSR